MHNPECRTRVLPAAPSVICYLLSVICYLLSAPPSAFAARIENVQAHQRPKSDIVDIYYDLVASEGGVFDVSLEIEGGGDKPVLSTLSGDVGVDVPPGRNKHIEWDAGADWPEHVQSNFVATVTAGPDLGMAFIPGGTNEGRNPHVQGDGTDLGPYSLTVESFWMDKTEVKYMRWKFVYDWAVKHGYEFDNAGGGKALDHPVQKVNWYDCVKWCNARSEMEGREPVYRVGGEVYRTGQSEPAADAGKDGYRLPSSEEWEYAARGGLVGKRFPWNVYVDDRPGVINHNRANFYNMRTFDYEDRYEEQGYHPDYASGGYPYTSPVASFRPNDYGLYDMAGNVREWTASASGTSMILRGGTWGSNGSICRIGATQTAAPGTTNYSTGFRTVRRP